MFKTISNSSNISKKIAMSAIVFLLAATTAIAIPKIGRPGCPSSYPGGNQVIYYECWYCPAQPANLGCFGDCASPCLDVFTYQEIEPGLFFIEVYDADGFVVGEFYADSWSDEPTTLPDGGLV